MAIILRLDRVMADRKISLNQLAEQVGISNVNLSNIKTGKSAPSGFHSERHLPLDCQPGISWNISPTTRKRWANSRSPFHVLLGRGKVKWKRACAGDLAGGRI